MSGTSPPPKIDPKEAAREGVMDLAPYIPGKPIHEVQREYGLTEVIKLASNECPLDPPSHIIQAMLEAGQHLCRYPDGHCQDLRGHLAQRLGLRPECLLFGNGAEECVRMVAQAFVNPGDLALISIPTFDAYETATRLVGGQVIRIPMKDFRIDVDAVLEGVDARTKLIWLGSPNNPTGTLLMEPELDRLLERLPEGKLVVLDEAYREYVARAQAADATKYLHDDGRVIGLRTFSKAFGLAGLRVGYLLAHPSLIDVIVQVKLPFNVSVPAQAAALKALEEEDFLKHHVRMIQNERECLRDELESRGLFVVPSEANFLFVRMPMDGEVLFRRLLPRGIIIRPGTIFGTPRFIRLTVGTREQNEKFLSALDDILAQD